MSQIIFNVKSDQGAYLGNASVLVRSKDGYGEMLLPNISAGQFALDLSQTGFEGVEVSDLLVTASAPGYQTLTANFSGLGDGYTFTLSKSNTTKYILIGGAVVGIGAAIAAMSKKKKKVGAFNAKEDLLPYAVPVALIIGGIAVYNHFFAKPSGQAFADKATADLAKLAAAGITPTFSGTQAEGWAGELRTAFDDCGTDENTVFSIMQEMQNDADISLLVSAYGTRGYKGCFDGDYFGSHPYNLAEAMTSELNSSAIASINSSFSAKGITFKF